MKLRKKENKKLEMNQLIIAGSFLLIITGAAMIGYKYYHNYKLDQKEEQQIEEFMETQKSIEITGTIEPDEQIEEPKEEKQYTNEEYIALIEIPKIGLKKGLYSKESSNNNVNRNIEILDESDMPDKTNGNVILAGHSGNGRTAYFKNLHKLDSDDLVYIYYQGGRYGYKLVNRYEITKTGVADIVRNGNRNTLTLITCKHNTDKQIVFIFELMKDGEV